MVATAPDAPCTEPLQWPVQLAQQLRLSPVQFELMCEANPDAVLELYADGRTPRPGSPNTTWYFMPTAKPIGAAERGLLKSQGQCHDCELPDRTRSGAGTSPICNNCAVNLAVSLPGDRRV